MTTQGSTRYTMYLFSCRLCFNTVLSRDVYDGHHANRTTKPLGKLRARFTPFNMFELHSNLSLTVPKWNSCCGCQSAFDVRFNVSFKSVFSLLRTDYIYFGRGTCS